MGSSVELWIGIAALIVGVLGITITFAVERYRRPRLSVTIGNFGDSPREP